MVEEAYWVKHADNSWYPCEREGGAGVPADVAPKNSLAVL